MLDTGVFDENRYFDVFVEYAKADAEDILIKISVANHGPEVAEMDLLPTIWFRNTWTWGIDERRPRLKREEASPEIASVRVRHFEMPLRWLICGGAPELLFTENETNFKRLFGVENQTAYLKDGINDYVVNGNGEAVNPRSIGSKAAARYHLTLGSGEMATVRLRLTPNEPRPGMLGDEFDEIFAARMREADEFYEDLVQPGASRTCGVSSARRSRGCSGPSSSIIMMSTVAAR